MHPCGHVEGGAEGRRRGGQRAGELEDSSCVTGWTYRGADAGCVDGRLPQHWQEYHGDVPSGSALCPGFGARHSASIPAAATRLGIFSGSGSGSGSGAGFGFASSQFPSLRWLRRTPTAQMSRAHVAPSCQESARGLGARILGLRLRSSGARSYRLTDPYSLCAEMFAANQQKTTKLWMWRMEYLHHEQRPLYFGEWF